MKIIKQQKDHDCRSIGQQECVGSTYIEDTKLKRYYMRIHEKTDRRAKSEKRTTREHCLLLAEPLNIDLTT